MGLKRDDSTVDKIEKLEGALADYGVQIREAMPLLAGLLSVPLHDQYPPLDMSPQRQRQKTMELLVHC